MTWLAGGRWAEETARIGAGVWAKPGEAFAANPHTRPAARPVTKYESDLAFDVMGAFLGRMNRDGGVTSGG